MKTPVRNVWASTLVLAVWGLCPCGLLCQVGIGTTSPHPSAALHLESTTRGFLPPRLSTVQMNAIGSPANGLLVFNTDSSHFYYYSTLAASWRPVGGNENCWTRGGNALANPAAEWVGTSNAQPLVLRTHGTERVCVGPAGGVGITGATAVPTPAATLDVGGDLALRISPVPIPTGTALTVNPGGYSVLICTPGAATTIQTIAPATDGKVLILLHPNVTTSNPFSLLETGNILTNTGSAVSATANNTPASATLMYSQALGKWVLLSFMN